MNPLKNPCATPAHGAAGWAGVAFHKIILGRNEWSGIKFAVFGLAPKLPITEEQRDWIDRSFVLGSLVGAHRLLQAELMLPTPEHFPDRL